jgi:hypothetical protein
MLAVSGLDDDRDFDRHRPRAADRTDDPLTSVGAVKVW